MLTSMAVSHCVRMSYLATQGFEMVLEKWAVGGITQAKTQTDFPLLNGHFKKRMLSYHGHL